jgi:hypothetical protein
MGGNVRRLAIGRRQETTRPMRFSNDAASDHLQNKY